MYSRSEGVSAEGFNSHMRHVKHLHSQMTVKLTFKAFIYISVHSVLNLVTLAFTKVLTLEIFPKTG